jgi:hypothetical protein
VKNIHVIPTDKPSRLYIGDNLNFVFGMIQTYIQSRDNDFTNQHIYITSDEDIQKGDWYYTNRFGIGIAKNEGDSKIERTTKSYKKIILTTDQVLIKDGVQAIDDEFLEWFVKNPSCEYVKITKDKIRQDKEFNDISHWNIYEYKISIPKEEPKFISGQFFLERADEVIVIHRPKQETLEEAVNDFKKTNVYTNEIKQKQERSYSEEEVLEILNDCRGENPIDIDKWFEQFKKR